ncbi:hypothetical protein BC941DRAFT_468971 [Chlamydoabsidia padenii]|nr:hypothetical protein BC941DRAFT_468971 [Chlamydoabsidia padenii]
MLFTSSSKVHQIEKDIDAARCKGQWQAIPELARRYVKHNPQGKALECIILAESTLVRLGHTSKPWDSKQVLTIQTQLLNVTESNDPAATKLKESANVILARLFFECEEYDRALSYLDGISQLNTESTGYSFVLFYQSVSIKALSLERMGKVANCLQTFDYISSLLDDRHPIKDLALAEWAEETLYQLVIRLAVDDKVMLQIMRSYHQTTSYQPVSWRTERRVDIHLRTIKLLSKLYRANEYIPSFSVNNTAFTTAQDQQQAFTDEITQQYTICEHILQTTLPFPSYGESNALLLELVGLLANDLDLMVANLDDWRGYKEVLERTSEKTFNSPCILRLLFSTCLRLGEYEEAQYALQAYLQLVGLISQEQIDTRDDGFAYVQDIRGLYIPHHPLVSSQQSTSVTTVKGAQHQLSPESDNQQTQDGESTSYQLNVLLESIKMFCKELKKEASAVEMAELALTLVDLSHLDSQLQSKVYRLCGVAYGLLASQSIDSEMRLQHYDKAISLLEQANTTWPDAWETHYCLALQHADMRNIDSAIYLIRRSLDLNMNHAPSWHLLALALSCPGQRDHSQALAIAAAGLDLGDNETINKSESTYNQYEQQLLLKMTHNKLLNASEGSERALEEHASLLKLYGKWLAAGSNDDYIDFSLMDGGDGSNENAWYGRSFYGGDKIPRKLVVSGSFGNVPSVVSSSYSLYPASSTSSSLAPPTVKSSKSLRRRSASSSMINHFLVPGNNGINNDLTNCDSASVFTTTTFTQDNKNNNTTYPKSKENSSPTTLAQRSHGLRKYASNSTLKVPGSSTPPSSHHWHGLHLFPSRSTSRRSTTAASINEGFGVDSTSTKTTPRYNSINSIQTCTSTATPTPSIHDSLSIAHSSPPSLSLSSLLIPQKQEPAITARGYLRHRQHHSRLCELWLMSAEWYLALNDHHEALQAISEAESAFSDHPDVWLLMGQINDASNNADHNDEQPQQDSASTIQYFEKGLLLQPGHVGCQLALAKLYMKKQMYSLAEGILTSMTQGLGWHSSEAWYLLGQLYHQTDRPEHTKDCLFYALDLETSRPIQPFDILPRII